MKAHSFCLSARWSFVFSSTLFIHSTLASIPLLSYQSIYFRSKVGTCSCQSNERRMFIVRQHEFCLKLTSISWTMQKWKLLSANVFRGFSYDWNEKFTRWGSEDRQVSVRGCEGSESPHKTNFLENKRKLFGFNIPSAVVDAENQLIGFWKKIKLHIFNDYFKKTYRRRPNRQRWSRRVDWREILFVGWR